jgi:hypothetical protein
MSKVNKQRAAKIGDFLFRHIQARHRFKDQLERPLPAHELATRIKAQNRSSKSTSSRTPIRP